MGVNDRYSRTPFPAYRYLPGRAPHPVRDARGHSYGAPETAETLDPARWASCETHLYAVDLFNAGYYWEAHEAWETLWRGAERGSETRLFLQGLIQVCAALVKHALDAPAPARSLAARGCEKLRESGGVRLGIRGRELAEAVTAHLAGRSETVPHVDLGSVA